MKLTFERLLNYLATHSEAYEPTFELDALYEPEATEAWDNYLDLMNNYKKEIDGLEEDSNDKKAIDIKYVGLLQDCFIGFRDSFFIKDVVEYVKKHISDSNYMSTLPFMSAAYAYNYICSIEKKFNAANKEKEDIKYVLKAKSLFAMYKMRFVDFYKECLASIGNIVETEEGATEKLLSGFRLADDKDLKKFIDGFKLTDKELWTPVYILTYVSLWSMTVILLQVEFDGVYKHLADIQNELFVKDFWFYNIFEAPEYDTFGNEISLLELIYIVNGILPK